MWPRLLRMRDRLNHPWWRTGLGAGAGFGAAVGPRCRLGLGLHLEPDLASVVELHRVEGGAARVVSAGSCALPAGSVVDSRIRQPRAVAGAVSELLADCGSQARGVSLALPPRSVVLRRLEMPTDADEPMRRRLAFDAALELLGADGAELAVDCRVVAARGLPPDRCEVLMAAARLEAVRDRLELASALGLKAVAVELETHAVLRAVQLIRDFAWAQAGTEGLGGALQDAATEVRGDALLVEVGSRGLRVVPLTGTGDAAPPAHGCGDPAQDRAADRVFEREHPALVATQGPGPWPMPDADEVLRLMEHACVATPNWRPREVLWAAVSVDPLAWEGLQARSPWPMRRLDPWQVWGEGPHESSEPACSPGLATWGLALRSLQAA